ncbi:hypothetical protein [uncultured Aquimarina sp.]|uniref:hypothetical protein n=1 Tax=uncultured Aquimarina sp. TaxID=575652 RepID=UPI002610DA5B|nr:hypothetical protein [uncultured Aquimarina sp.]
MKAIRPHCLLKISCKKLKQDYYYTILIILMVLLYPTYSTSAQTTVANSLEEFQTPFQNNNQEISLEWVTYYLEYLPSTSRVINTIGSGNTIDMMYLL